MKKKKKSYVGHNVIKNIYAKFQYNPIKTRPCRLSRMEIQSNSRFWALLGGLQAAGRVDEENKKAMLCIMLSRRFK